LATVIGGRQQNGTLSTGRRLTRALPVAANGSAVAIRCQSQYDRNRQSDRRDPPPPTVVSMVCIDFLGGIQVSVSRALFGLTAAVFTHVTAAQLPSAAVFGSLPAMESPAISADGDRIAFIAHAEAESFIFVATIDDMQITSAIQVNEGKLRDVIWANDEALVFTASTSDEASFLPGAIETAAPYGVDLAGDGAVTRLLRGRPRAGRTGVTIAGQSIFASSGAQLIGWERSTGNVLFPKTEVPDFERVLYSIDPKSDRQTVVDRGSRFTRDWIVDESGEPIYRIDYSQRIDVYTLLERRRRGWEVIVEETTQIPEMSVSGLDAASRLIVRARPRGTRFFGLYALDTDSGDLGEAVLVHEEYDVAGSRIDPYTHRVVGGWVADDGTVWFDEEIREHQALLDEAFPGESVAIISWSRDRQHFLVETESGQRSPAFYVYDASEPSVAQIGTAYAGLQGFELPVRRPYSYTARDGTEIPGYITQLGNAGEPTPLVVLPHGGPAARDYPGFDWMAHFFATRGYTVLQPNFRGSYGFGKAWEEAGHGEWGIGVMQHDVSDGVAALVEEGVVDADRVCIVGASYGGYAALAGAAFTPQL